jgi:hypothetical protein
MLIRENGGGPGVRLRKAAAKKSPRKYLGDELFPFVQGSRTLDDVAPVRLSNLTNFLSAYRLSCGGRSPFARG